jgi:hypothetical protein
MINPERAMKKSEPTPIRNHVELSYRIMKLNELRAEQEEVIKRDVKELYYSFHPTELIKKLWSDVKGDTETKNNLGKAGLNFGADLLIGKIFGRNKSIKGFLTSVLVEKLASYFLNKNSDKIMDGVSKLTNLFKKAA